MHAGNHRFNNADIGRAQLAGNDVHDRPTHDKDIKSGMALRSQHGAGAHGGVDYSGKFLRGHLSESKGLLKIRLKPGPENKNICQPSEVYTCVLLARVKDLKSPRRAAG